MPNISSAYELRMEDGCGYTILDFTQNQPKKEYMEIYLYGLNKLSNSLELCIVDTDKHKYGYEKCGSRDIHDPNFFKNAEINIRNSREYLVQYDKILGTIPELDSTIKGYRDFLEVSIWTDEQQLEYYKTWNIDVLNRKYKNFHAPQNLGEILSKIQNLQNNNEKYRVVWYEWSTAWNHVNHEYNPIHTNDADNKNATIWKKFLEKYKVSEKFIDDGNCD